jgi:alpha-tubulin suppressor-like RCC1 family protein
MPRRLRPSRIAAIWLTATVLACGGRTGFEDESVLPESEDASAPPGPRVVSNAPDASLETGTPAPDAGGNDAREPVDDRPLTARAVAIAAGWYTNCVLLDDGTVACWGGGVEGELGDGTLADRATPERVPGIEDATALSTGMYVRCALLRGGDVDCWGDNEEGEIQNPPSAEPNILPTPVAVPRWSGAKQIVSAFRTTCALLADSVVSCAGTSPTPTSPWTIPVASGSTQLAISDLGGCALAPDATVECWGYDDRGELGNGTANFAILLTASRVPNLEGVTAITSGTSGFTCALLADTTVSCWGDNSTGQLGSSPVASCMGGNGGACSEVPIPVPGLTGVTALAAGDSFACALLSNGTVDCWGDNVNGELGNGTTMFSFMPIPVDGLSHVTAIAAAGYHICALVDDGSIACWGSDSDDELGAPGPDQCAARCSTRPIAFRL